MHDRFAMFALLLSGLIAQPVSGDVAASDLPSMTELNSGAAVQTDRLPQRPHVVVVWMESCAPCVEELRHLREIADRTPGWSYVTLALDAPDIARAALSGEAEFATAWVADGKPAEVLARLNPELAALPMTIALSPTGRVCARRVGLLGSDIINGWTAQCSK
jgi:hypothetical protein